MGARLSGVRFSILGAGEGVSEGAGEGAALVRSDPLSLASLTWGPREPLLKHTWAFFIHLFW